MHFKTKCKNQQALIYINKTWADESSFTIFWKTVPPIELAGQTLILYTVNKTNPFIAGQKYGI